MPAKRKRTPPDDLSSQAKAARQQQLAQRLAQQAVTDAAVRTMFARRLAQKPQMKGGLGRDLYARNADGSQHAINAVSLDRIPASRAVVVGRQTFDAKTLRSLFQQNPRALNPLTRQPFPQQVYEQYGPRALSATFAPPPRITRDDYARRAWRLGVMIAKEFKRRVDDRPNNARSMRIDQLDVLDAVLDAFHQQNPGPPRFRRRQYTRAGYAMVVCTTGAIVGRGEYTVTLEHRVPFDGRLTIEVHKFVFDATFMGYVGDLVGERVVLLRNLG